ncbi:MAG: DUF1491 family protein [Marivibrio sp.]|uniref:DUF1491 family protein n=1 Tax=Marivibrio sp. TaxID=2039719 RepID=UPI0032EB5293
MADDDRLPTHLWVGAALARCSAEGVPAMVLHKGERMSGVVLVKISRLAEGGDAVRLLTQQRDLDGRLGWVPALKEDRPSEADADAYIARARARDPDLWAVEVEDPTGRNPFDPKEAEE